jgi:hypothetical protein
MDNRVRKTLTTLFLSAALFMTACVARSNQAAGPANPSKPSPFSRHILVHDRALNLATGELIADYDSPGFRPIALPVPGRPGWYELPAVYNNGKTHPARRINPTDDTVETVPVNYLINFDEKTREVVRVNEDGTERWRFAQGGWLVKTPTGEYDKKYRPDAIVVDDGRFYAAFPNALVVKNDITGEDLWRIEHRCSKLLLADDQLLALMWPGEGHDRRCEVWAIEFGTGEPRFKIPLWLPTGYSPVLEVLGDHFIASNGNSTVVFDREGFIRMQAAEGLGPVLERRTGGWYGSGLNTVSRWNGFGHLCWAIPLGNYLERELLELPDGDLIVAEHALRHESPVRVTRLDDETGDKVWARDCEFRFPDGVWGGRSRNVAYVELIDGYLVVCSLQTYSTFVEVLNPSDGSQVQRWDLTGRMEAASSTK